MQQFLKRQIAGNRRSGIVRYMAGLSQRFLNAYHYTGQYEFETNGEKFALEQFFGFHGDRAKIWDVGAHLGEYAQQAHDVAPQASIVSFEIIPEIAERLQARMTGDWFELRQIGLSDASGEILVSWNKKHDTTNAIHPFVHDLVDPTQVELRSCPITTIDRLIEQGEAPPDLLKIDVEGHERAVLFGAGELLAGDRAPAMIQFEYGGTWIPSGSMLFGVQTFLEGFGYSVGRLYPDHVEFGKYTWQNEHFRMGNMIAAKPPALVRMLAN